MDEAPPPARDTIRDMWASRPVRPRDDRRLAGVAAGIARRYELDPTLVRIGLVVAAVVGPGLPLYLACCAVLPDAGPPGGLPDRSGPASVLSLVLLVTAALLTVPLVLPVERLIATIATGALLLALHHSRGARAGGRTAATAATPLPVRTSGPPVPVPPGADPATLRTATTGTAASDTATTDTAATETTTTETATSDTADPETTRELAAPDAPTARRPVPARTPPGWDPLGTAPFAWDLPDPGPEPPPRPRHPALTPVTVVVALVVAGIVAVPAVLAPGSVPASAVPGAALAVVAAGLLIGALRRAGRWLIPVAVLLAVLTGLAAAADTAVGPDGWAVRDGIGPVTASPATVAALRPVYRLGTGTITLDLTRLDLADPAGRAGPVRTRAEVGAGTVSVQVPPGADLVVRGTAGYGDVTVDGRSESGRDVRLEVTDPGPDGPGGRHLELDLGARVGAVEVRRAG